MMKYDFAPLESITTFRFRRLHREMFSGVDRYYMPFLSACHTESLKKRELLDIDPENNAGIPAVPQILTGRGQDFIWAAELLYEKGYREINFNLGCPSNAVVSRKRGAGFLSEPDRLDRFFEEVFDWLSGRKGEDVLRISVKTRTGRRTTEAVPRLIEIYNRYPFAEIIVHPRLGKDFYRGSPDLDIFTEFYDGIRHPLTYNGDILDAAGRDEILKRFPGIRRIMIGRGLLRNPALARELSGGEALKREELFLFQERLYRIYLEGSRNETDAVSKMKELWSYLGTNFPGKTRELRRIMQSRDRTEYESAVNFIKIL